MSFLDLDRKDPASLAVLDDRGGRATYGDLIRFTGEFGERIGRRTLIIILTDNSLGAVAGYAAALSGRIVPLLLNARMEQNLLDNLLAAYRPEYLWLPRERSGSFGGSPLLERWGYVLLPTGASPPALHQELSLLLTTSGSTGSPKLVRHSYANLEANARNITAFFGLSPEDRPLVDLPVNYTYGLSVVSSHLYAGATLLLTGKGLMQKEFWEFLKEQRATTFTGVPYSYELLAKLRFFRMDLPDLKLLTQGGGKLREDLQARFAEYAEATGKRFIVTYGQTEGTARMAYLPAELASVKLGSIGRAIPGGTLHLVDEDGAVITEAGVEGEMVYTGPNVTLGYAETAEDLSAGDERYGVLPTGDLARMDEEGFFYILGRKSRFLKLFGYRVSLDETEHLIREEFRTDCACTGTDDGMQVYLTDPSLLTEVGRFLVRKTGLFPTAFQVRAVAALPRNEAGKILYAKLGQP